MTARLTLKFVLVGLVVCMNWIAPQSARAQLPPENIVYVTTNDPTPGQNAVLAFRRNSNCSLTFIGRFQMRGTGVGNPNFRLGTLDSDQSLVVTRDRRFLFAVNSGSDSIAAFSIQSNGMLRPVDGSPFPSGGHMPASIGVRDSFLYVAHKNEVPGENPASFTPPNLTAFRVTDTGQLEPVHNSTIGLPQGSSPTQALISNDGQFVFSASLLVDFPTDFRPTDGFPEAPGAGGGDTLRSFRILPNGRLKPNPGIRLPEPDEAFPDPLGLLSGTMHISGTTNGALAMQDHPFLPILYVAFPFRFQIGVYTWEDKKGELTLRNVVGNSGQVIGWIQVSDDGRALYTTNQLDSTVSVYGLSDPLNPVEVDFDDLRLAPGATMGGLAAQLSLTPDGRCLYVVEQRITDGAGDGSANALHILQASPGNLDEPFAPFNLADLGVPRTARPQGIAAF